MSVDLERRKVEFKQTVFHVLVAQSFILRIDEPSVALSELHRAYGVETSAIITAWNPLSEKAGLIVNQAAQDALACDIDACKCQVIPAEAVDLHGGWPQEPCFLVLGIGLSLACRLGRKYQQTAIVFCDTEALPHLILL